MWRKQHDTSSLVFVFLLVNYLLQLFRLAEQKCLTVPLVFRLLFKRLAILLVIIISRQADLVMGEVSVIRDSVAFFLFGE
ncbi:phage holin family protein [Listeria floridensis]|uniref:phage holin family protein n=1 Tax=Listeria floridensis TaxID=1494962 RepID=UPI003B98484E